MSEITEEVKTFKVSMKCDKCGKGFMKLVGGMALMSDLPLYKHRCTECGHEEFYSKEYPYFDKRPVKQEFYFDLKLDSQEDDGK